MKIERIIVRNFRLLKNFSVDLEDGLSLVIGKNNVGKTSLLLILDQFIGTRGEGKRTFHFNDLNLDTQETVKSYMEQALLAEDSYTPVSISLRLVISYDDNDVLENVSPLLMDLDVDNHYIAIGFDCFLPYEGYKTLHSLCVEHKAKFDQKHQAEEEHKVFDVMAFLNDQAISRFQQVRKSVMIDKKGNIDESVFIDIKDIQGFKLEDVIQFQCIGARRDVDNRDVDKTLSTKTSDLYKAIEETAEQIAAKENFIERLKETDTQLTDIYSDIFSDIVEKIRQFGGLSPNDTVIKVVSTLQHRELLKGNTTVKYEHDHKDLPENFNGLGYMNLISIIFDIQLMMKRYAKGRVSGGLADINLLFIEEPEAHTHPQMQYVFIKNIKSLLSSGVHDEHGNKRPLQYIVSTHSSHIVADSDYDDIKYLHRPDGKNEVIAKSLNTLSKVYNDETEKAYLRFLKQYITINRSELFFADKAILIEGDTERILLPAIIRKLDLTVPAQHPELPLRSQNVSIIEAGAHAEIFIKLLNFLGLTKVLVLTDFDCCSAAGHHAREKYGQGKNQVTSNTAIKFFFKENKSDVLAAKTTSDKCFAWDEQNEKMAVNNDGNYMVCYQTAENGYQPRSFEDDFMALNREFVISKNFSEKAINPNYKNVFDAEDKAYEAAENVGSKATFALEILLNSEEREIMVSNKNVKDPYGGWDIPTYIKEGLLWLRK